MPDPLPCLLIVAHGQPSNPAPAAAALQAFAAKVGAALPLWRVSSVTLAEDGAAENGAFERAVQGAQGAPRLIYPMFMAKGWFVERALKERLARANASHWQILEPFGTQRAVQDLACDVIKEAGVLKGGQVLIAAHGSFRSPAPARVAHDLARRIEQRFELARGAAAFIDQEPRLSQMRGFSSDALCLPFFAAAGGHVNDDLPAALHEAGFEGRVLPVLGCDARVPELVARACRAATLNIL